MSLIHVVSASRIRVHADKAYSTVDESDARHEEDSTFAPTAHLYAQAIADTRGQGQVEGMKMPQLKAPSYVVGDASPDACGLGYQPIANVRHCKDAAKVLGLHYSAVVNWPYAPHGCFTTPALDAAVAPTVWFNKDAGRETTEGTVICEKGRSGKQPQYFVNQTTADEINWMQHGVQPQRAHAEGHSVQRPQYIVKLMTADEMHRIQHGVQPDHSHVEGSFVRVGAGHCLNGKGSTVDGDSVMTNSLAECKKRCVASEQCEAVQWHILPLLSCTLFQQNFTKTSESQVSDFKAWRGPECWNKQASNHSTKACVSGNSTKACASVSVLQRLYSTMKGMSISDGGSR